jgi:hypothetical protein
MRGCQRTDCLIHMRPKCNRIGPLLDRPPAEAAARTVTRLSGSSSAVHEWRYKFGGYPRRSSHRLRPADHDAQFEMFAATDQHAGLQLLHLGGERSVEVTAKSQQPGPWPSATYAA